MAVLFSLFFPLTSLANTDREIECLAKNIYYESGAESLAGKKAVAQVTLNRVNHPSYPSSVCGVVYQKHKSTCQFSWVCEPKRAIKWASENWRQSLMVAEMFLTEGHEFDRIGNNALFFHTKQLPFTWDKKYKRVATIGNHIFYEKKMKVKEKRNSY
jgi:spore germination cell wall hydrolase CwlJ-like protein